MMTKSTSAKSITINDIAKRAKVSKSTVSRVLNDSTPVNEQKREAVEEAMKELNFQPNMFARSLAGGQTKTIGVLTQNIGSPFYDSISQGIIARLTDSSYSPVFADGQWQAETGRAAVETLLDRRVDGLILVGGSLPSSELESLHDRVPCIAVGNQVVNWDGQCVCVDNELAAYRVTKYLIGLGHRKIAHITGIKDHPDSIRRREGYQRALTESGIEFCESLVREGNFDGDSGIAAIESLLSSGTKFTAVFAANDMSAFGARLALYQQGIRVPEDVSIVGFDDQAEAALMTPPLTTVRQPAQEMGAAAADAIVELLGGRAFTLPDFPPELIIRHSTKACNDVDGTPARDG